MKYFDYSDIFASLRWLYDKNVVEKFESQFSHYLGKDYVIATSYGRTALFLSLLAIEATGKEVIIPSFICTVVRQAVSLAGAIPKFVDISHETLGYDLNHLKNSITSGTKAIVVTHFFGKVAPNFEEILTLGRDNGIIILEDCAHSMGATFNGKKVGTFGEISIFSMTKSNINFGGGILATDNESIYLKAMNIVENEKFNFMERLSALPFILTYGLKQIIEKIYFDRVGNSIFKWWLIKMPNCILYLLNLMISIMNLLMSLIVKQKKKTT